MKSPKALIMNMLLTAGYEIKNTLAGDPLTFLKLVSLSNHVHKKRTGIENYVVRGSDNFELIN